MANPKLAPGVGEWSEWARMGVPIHLDQKAEIAKLAVLSGLSPGEVALALIMLGLHVLEAAEGKTLKELVEVEDD